MKKIVRDVLQDMELLDHSYHNEQHVAAVMSGVAELAVAGGLSREDSQLLQLAALFHDYDHAGKTFRQQVRSAESNFRSNEEFAAISADQQLDTLLSVPQRVALQGLILATSFGQGDLAKIPQDVGADGYRPYRPSTKLEKLLAFADVMNALKGPDTFSRESIDVMREGGKANLPATFDTYLDGRLGFLGYLKMKLHDVSDTIGPRAVQKYEDQLAVVSDYITRLKGDPNRAHSPMGVAFAQVKSGDSVAAAEVKNPSSGSTAWSPKVDGVAQTA